MPVSIIYTSDRWINGGATYAHGGFLEAFPAHRRWTYGWRTMATSVLFEALFAFDREKMVLVPRVQPRVIHLAYEGSSG